ncbi:zinc finger protein 483-like isoform X2 [Crotalus tigris]|uniref:zinc finger protein 483-like isoform X2 n=1 Tax=Crotalus tigris TaxID=88082 RepID=UPI00192F9B4A|nr:zinc finger protein 483-like isoform X2 [Crotalus tigris]XP_039201299.1 zinc finger protein 483-like isoform X2 [Crotalus tigris]
MEPKSRTPQGEDGLDRVRKACSEDFSKCTEMEPLGWKLPQGIKRESCRVMQQPWKTQWRDFLKTLPCPHVGWEEDSEVLGNTPWEDPKAFLVSFEQVAQACQWPKGEWVTRLLPALSGEVKRAFSGLEARDKEDYGKVKAAILRGEAIRIEVQRQHFRQFRFQEIEDPRRVYGQLQRLCRQWLKPERRSKEQILELLILEQFLTSLPPELQSWIRAGGPDTCSQAVALIENFLLNRQEAKEPPQEVITKSSLGEERVTLKIDQEEIYKDIKQNNNGVIHLLDNGSKESSGSSSLLPPEGEETDKASPSKDLLDLKDAGVSLNVVDPTPIQPGQQTMFWQVMQEEDGDADSLEGLLVPKPDLASNPEEEEEPVFVQFPVESERIPDHESGSQKPPLTIPERMRNLRKAPQERRADVGPSRGGIGDSAARSPLQDPALPGSRKAKPAPSSEIEKAWEECERKAVEKLEGYLREKGWKLQTAHSSQTGILQDVLSIVCKGRTAASLPVLTSPVQGPPLSSQTPPSEVSTESRISSEAGKDSATSSPPPSLPPLSLSSQGGLSDRSIRLKRKRSLPARFQC